MNSDRLAAWIKSEAEKASSFRQLALSLGTSPTTINALRDQQRQTISEDLLQAIAFRRGESILKTAQWLDMEPPVSSDLPDRLREVEKSIAVMQAKLEYAYQRVRPNDSAVATYLIERGIDLRDRSDQDAMRVHVAELAGSL